ncbi:MAG: hypothetical protein IIW37_02540, partial [Bacteroidaceae bacterium]|nr:hypothetical protein [Bacteroidaceae bacterium]
MGSQFSAFLEAVCRLYEVEGFPHKYHRLRDARKFEHQYPYEREDKKHLLTSRVVWDEEGRIYTITFARHCDMSAPCEMG